MTRSRLGLPALLALVSISISHLEAEAAAGAAERCSDGGCHAGAAKLPAHTALLRKHAHPPLGCIACHAGGAEGTTADAAHPRSGPEALLARANVQAGCVACHVPGSVRGMERIIDGGRVYLALGCQLCHRTLGQGINPPVGPGLDGVGARGVAHLKRVVWRASEVFPKTVMPAFDQLLDAHPSDGEALIAYLMSLRGLRRQPTRARSDVLCVSCHGGKVAAVRGAGSGSGRSHRCAWIKNERAVVRCARCHPRDSEQESTRECSYIEQRKPDCGVCHGLGPGERRGVEDGR